VGNTVKLPAGPLFCADLGDFVRSSCLFLAEVYLICLSIKSNILLENDDCFFRYVIVDTEKIPQIKKRYVILANKKT